MFVPVILAGGSGTRLWPLSRQGYPKQFINLLDGDLSLFQSTVQRALGVPGAQKPIIICNNENRFIVAEQLQCMKVDAQIILEPVGRNTAPAIALAALESLAQENDYPMLVLPSDHKVSTQEQFEQTVLLGVDAAVSGRIVTFGIQPNRPETAYGYILASEQDSAHARLKRVEKFVEKPDLDTAKRYLSDGGYYWNSGMFVLKPSLYLSELEKYAEDVFTGVKKAYSGRKKDLDFIRLNTDQFVELRSESIDYALMEHTECASLIPFEGQWTDVGSWDAVSDVLDSCTDGNALLGDSWQSDCQGCLVRSESRFVAAIGLKDVVIVETPDAVLVLDKKHSQKVKSVVEYLKSGDRSEWQFHKRVFRPWGWYETVSICERFQTKRIMVKPGHSLSLQKHFHRAEHWVVVKGTAEVTCGEDVKLFTEDQSTYIPLGQVHRLANPGLITLEIIEVQTGSYLGEDDIVRFEDSYGR